MKKKLNALLLTFCIVFSVVAAVLPVYAVEADGENGVVGATDSVLKAEKLVLSEDDVPEVISFQSAQEKGHILRLRDKESDDYTVVFLNDDNTETMYLFAEPVKYTDEYGNKKDKSTALTLKNNAYTMAENDISVSFPREVANGISISKGDISISMSPVTTTVSDRLTASTDTEAKLGRVSENKMVYTDVFAGASLVYTPLYSGFKEDIVLDRFDGVNEFSFILNTNGLYPIKQENGAVWFYDPYTDELVAKMMQVVCYDSENDFSEGDVRITEVKENQIYTFTIIADTAFLTDKNTAYPVYIDPTLTLNTETAIEDTVVYSGKTSRNYATHSYLNVGYVDSSYKNGEMLVKFPTLATNSVFANIEPSHITSASLVYYTASGKSGTQRIQTYQLNMGNWDVNSVTWSSIPIFAPPTLLSTTTVSTSGGTATTIDITNAAKTWADSSSSVTPNQGLIICNETESDATKCRDFMSVDYAASSSSREQYMPRLEIVFQHTIELISSLTDETTHIKIGDKLSINSYIQIFLDGERIYNNGTLLSFRFLNIDGTVSDSLTSENGVLGLNSTLGGQIEAKKVGTATVRVECYSYAYAHIDITFTVTKQSITGDFVYVINNDDTAFQSTRERWCDLNIAYGDADIESINFLVIEEKFLYCGQYVEDLISTSVTPVYDENGNKKARFSYELHENMIPENDYWAYPSGYVKIRASINGVYKIITINIICDSLDLPTNDYESGITLSDGRYLAVNHSTQQGYDNAYMLAQMLASHGLTASPLIKCDYTYDADNPLWFAHTYRDMSGSVFQRSFLQYMRHSKVVCVLSHGSATGISMSSSDASLQLTADQIYSLRDGFFAYCDLVIYSTCASGSQLDNDTINIMEATLAKGAKNVIGYQNGVQTAEACYLERSILSIMSSNPSEAYVWASASPTSCEPSEIYNCTPKDAVEYVTQHTEIPASQYIIILTEEDLTNSNSEGNT